MNRPIKFRAKGKYDGQWHYGGLIQVSKGYSIATKIEDAFEMCAVDPETIGQFTGLYDKNGKEIYEGDIVCRKDDSHLYVVIIPHKNVYYASIEVRNGEVHGGFPLHPLLSQDRKSIEIMDNIHNNPDPIKKFK